MKGRRRKKREGNSGEVIQNKHFWFAQREGAQRELFIGMGGLLLVPSLRSGPNHRSRKSGTRDFVARLSNPLHSIIIGMLSLPQRLTETRAARFFFGGGGGYHGCVLIVVREMLVER